RRGLHGRRERAAPRDQPLRSSYGSLRSRAARSLPHGTAEARRTAAGTVIRSRRRDRQDAAGAPPRAIRRSHAATGGLTVGRGGRVRQPPVIAQTQLRTRLAELLGAPVVLEELKYKPDRRRTSRATGPRGSAIVKQYTSERAPTVAARVAALADGPADPAVA